MANEIATFPPTPTDVGDKAKIPSETPAPPPNEATRQVSNEAQKKEKERADKSLQTQINNGNIPKVEVEKDQQKEDPAAQERVEKEKRARQTELNRAFQNEFLATADQLYPPTDRSDPEKARVEVKAAMAPLQKEIAAGIFGNASKDAYTRFARWLEKGMVPQTVEQLHDMQLTPPTGSPIKLTNEQLDPDQFSEAVASGKLRSELKLDTKLPNEQDLAKIQSVGSWISQCHTVMREAQDQVRTKEIKECLQDKHPEWLPKDGVIDKQSLSAALDYLDLEEKMRHYVQVQYELSKSAGMDLRFEPPAGVDASTKNADGSLSQINIQMPADLREKLPENACLMDSYRQWLDQNSQKLDKAVIEWINVKSNPDSLIQWGDVRCAHAKGVFDAKGNFLRVLSEKDAADYKPVDGEKTKTINNIRHTFEVTHEGDKIVVTQTVQAQKVPFFGYLNIGAKDVGGKMPIDQKKYSPDDLVPIQRGGELNLVKASELEDFQKSEPLQENGGKVFIATLDAAMTISGGLELKAAFRGLQLAELGLEAAANQVEKNEIRTALTWSLAKTFSGAMGYLDNPGALEYTPVEHGVKFRNSFFLMDTGGGLMPQSALKMLPALEKYTNASKKLAEIAEYGPIATVLHKAAEFGFKATEYPMMAGITSASIKTVRDRFIAPEPNHLERATSLGGDGIGQQSAEQSTKSAETTGTKTEKFSANGPLLGDYETALSEGQSQSVKDELKQQIFAPMERLLKAKEGDPEKERFKQELAQKIGLTQDDMIKLFQANREGLTDTQIVDAQDPGKQEQLKMLQPGLEWQAQDLMVQAKKQTDSKDKVIRDAACVALLALSQNEDGSMPKSLVNYQIEQTAVSLTNPLNKKSNDANISIEMTSDALINYLKHDLQTSKDASIRQTAGDVLYRCQAITAREYGATLEDILTNPTSTNEQKTRALAGENGKRLSDVIDAVGKEETAERASGTVPEYIQMARSLGASSESLESTITSLAATEKDDQLRARASGIMFARSIPIADARKTVLDEIEQQFQPGKDGNTAGKEGVTELLMTYASMQADNEEPEQQSVVKFYRRNADVALAALSGSTDTQAPKMIDEALVQNFDGSTAATVLSSLQPFTEERLKRMSTEEPALLKALQTKAIDALRIPDQKDNEAAQQVAIESAATAQLMRNADQQMQQKFNAKLRAFLDPNSTQFAGGSPSILESTIRNLAERGDKDSIELIRQYVTSKDAIDIDGHKISNREGKPEVRLAAIEALKKLADPALPAILEKVRVTEEDPAVAKTIQDYIFLSEKASSNKASTEESSPPATETSQYILDGASAELKNTDTDKMRYWLSQNYSLLDPETYKSHCDAAAEAAVPSFLKWFLSQDENHKRENDARQRETTIRDQQFGEICKLAKGSDDFSQRAQVYLYQVIASGASSLSESKFPNVNTTDQATIDRDSSAGWQNRAAQALADCCQPGVTNRATARNLIAAVLTDNKSLSPEVRLTLLSGWTAIRSEGNLVRTSLTEKQNTDVLCMFAESELGRRESERSAAYESALVNELRHYDNSRVQKLLRQFTGLPKAS
jgi:hypothetical protein